VKDEKDIKWKSGGVDWCATDGCSPMAVAVMATVQEQVGLEYMPSWVQFRERPPTYRDDQAQAMVYACYVFCAELAAF
jgi:hypothetical protein